MATKRLASLLVCAVTLFSWVVGISTEAIADTIKGKGVTTVSKVERLPIPDAENHNLGLTAREAIILFENGEVATAKTMVIWDMTGPSSGWSKGYTQYTFLDGSTIPMNFQQQVMPPTGETNVQYDSKVTGDIIKGTGKFEGVKGTRTSSSKAMKAEKGEPPGKLISDLVINYSK